MMESIVRRLRAVLRMLEGLHGIKKHKIRSAEGRDIRALVSGALIEFKRTVAPFGADNLAFGRYYGKGFK